MWKQGGIGCGWLTGFPEASSQRQVTPQAAPSFGQPWPISRLGRAIQALLSTQLQAPTPATLCTAFWKARSVASRGPRRTRGAARSDDHASARLRSVCAFLVHAWLVLALGLGLGLELEGWG